ncbi:MAG TPA: tripartite tricarboxylate transporter substrate-binding protein [Burkholderiales bacterium]|nr:tripartite tricarboxylate transporter substrate-binding protein [Burkholderiales bacterium]
MKYACPIGGAVRALVVVAALAVCGASGAADQAYPAKTVRMLTAELGGGSDLSARLIAQGLSTSLGQQVIVDNRVGGIIIADIAAKAAPDGYTLFTYSNTLWLIPLMRSRTSYDPLKDFAPITLVGSSPMILVVHPSVTATTVRDLISLAKARPGELNFATGPSGAIPHLSAELFKAMSGIDIVHIAYKGVGLAVTDVMGGRVQMMFPNANAALPHIRSGRLRGLAVTSAKPSGLAAGFPTMAAAGLPGYECVAMYAVLVPARTPGALVKRLNQEIVGVLTRPDVREKFLLASVEIVASSPEELTATMKSEMARMGKVIKAAGIRLE